MTGSMVKSLFNMFKKPKNGTELLTELDISRVVGAEDDMAEQPVVEEETDAELADVEPSEAVETWKQNDLDLLQTTWEACCTAPQDEGSVDAFRSALHNLHGASGAYGGGALTRLSGSLQELVTGVEDLQSEAALVNLHVQACRAAALGEGNSADDVADAVCQALEDQVHGRLHG